MAVGRPAEHARAVRRRGRAAAHDEEHDANERSESVALFASDGDGVHPRPTVPPTALPVRIGDGAQTSEFGTPPHFPSLERLSHFLEMFCGNSADDSSASCKRLQDAQPLAYWGNSPV